MNALADAVMRNFNPRSPCGERLENKPTAEELTQFQSTLPVWGATVYVHRYGHRHGISIHAPRVGSDAVHDGHHIARGGISIHAPRVGSDLT